MNINELQKKITNFSNAIVQLDNLKPQLKVAIQELAQQALAELNAADNIDTTVSDQVYIYRLNIEKHKVIDICDDYDKQLFTAEEVAAQFPYATLPNANVHKGCYCTLVTHKQDMENRQWKLEIKDDLVEFINTAPDIARKRDGETEQVEEGKIAKEGKSPDTYADDIINKFKLTVQVKLKEIVQTRLSKLKM